ncbi:tetratricopeptide repeat protein [Rodentibacter caecimuris]|uniref:tetratricopeptide repeat protein n=1 Tax=Rodentibacter caecimuris TaxID=1796644 RepID=UPI00258D3DAF|nr:tetratricopeptide repeat protein [Rodentibacter heylii]
MKFNKTTLFFTALFAFSTATISSVVYADNASQFQQGVEAAEKGDYQTAYNLWKPLAEQGDSSTQYNLGVMYHQGLGIKQDYHQAVKWYTLAAEQGEAMAQTNLGIMYRLGQGVKQDISKAKYWASQACKGGNQDGCEVLAMLEEGI